MVVKQFDILNGLTVHDNVKLIRVKNRTNSYLIMEDHSPIIGKIDGNVTILSENDSEEVLSIKGYFMHKNNTFEFIIQERLNDGKAS